jgi:hypothetical protein
MGIGGDSLGVKWHGLEADHYLHLVWSSRMVELYLHFPIGLHGIVLNYLSIGKILPLTFYIFAKIWMRNLKEKDQ